MNVLHLCGECIFSELCANAMTEESPIVVRVEGTNNNNNNNNINSPDVLKSGQPWNGPLGQNTVVLLLDLKSADSRIESLELVAVGLQSYSVQITNAAGNQVSGLFHL